MTIYARRAMTVLLLASLLIGSDGRVSAAQGSTPAPPRHAPPAALRWVTRLATALRRAEQKLRLSVRRVRRVTARSTPRHADPLVRALLLPHQFRLPPPIAG